MKKIRQAKKMSMTELAEKSKVAKSYISSIERNIKVNPSIQVLEKISKILEVPLNYILSTDDTPDEIDEEWVHLMQKAISLGVTKEQFEEFLVYKELEKKFNS